MSIRFAAARGSLRARLAPVRVQAMRLVPANDNGQSWRRVEALDAALRHFARHGMAAAQIAADNARVAGEAGDDKAFAWWLDVCRTLDRRMARQFERGVSVR
jgi:hypothetical protein